MTQTNGHAPTDQTPLREDATPFGLGLPDFLNPFSFRFDNYRAPGAWLPLGSGNVTARQHGRNRPFAWSDVDLDNARGLARWLGTKNGIAVGAVECLADYTVRTGFGYEARPGKRLQRDRVAIELAAQVGEVVEEFLSLNTVEGDRDGACEPLTWADREWQAVADSVVDGVAILRAFDQGDGTTLVRPIAAEQLRQDPATADDPNTTFGKRNAPGDVERVTHYQVTYDGVEFEEVPASDVAEIKLNTPSNVKVGLPDFYATGEAFDQVDKLLQAMRITAKMQASIPWVTQYANATGAQIGSHVAGLSALNAPRVTNPLTGREVRFRHLEPGTELHVKEGQQYLPGPLAANTTNHISIVQAALRALATRWRMPEYMISSDASNANFASTMVAGSPFVVRVECRQARYGRFFLRVLWMAIRNAARRGRFVVGGRRYSWREVSSYVDVHPTPPLVAIADQAQQSEIDHKDIAGGAMSLITRMERRGLDPEKEKKRMAEWPVTRIQGRATDVDRDGNPVAPQGKGPDQQQAQRPGTGMDQGGRPAQVRESFDPEKHPHDERGRWAGKALYTPSQVPIFDRGQQVAGKHYRNMRSLLGGLQHGTYEPGDALEDVEIYLDHASDALRREYSRFYAHLKGRLGTSHGEEALKSPEWDAVRDAVRSTYGKAQGHLDDMADVVRLYAKSAIERPGEPVKVGADDLNFVGVQADKVTDASQDAINSIMDAVDAFRAKHKALGEAVGGAAWTLREEWDETKHPRGQPDNKGQFGPGGGGPGGEADGKGGESGEKKDAGGPKGGPAWESSRAVKDLLSGKAQHDMFSGRLGGSRDTMLEEIIKDQGKDGKPKLLNSAQMHALKKQGHSILWRGVSKPEAAEGFKTGDYWGGSGIFGNGTYAQKEGGLFGFGGKSEAKAIAEVKEYGEHVLRIAMPPDAKVASLAQVESERAAYRKELGQRRWRNEITQDQYEQLESLTEDKGRFAALMGYDAVKVTSGGYWNVLNRGILAVQEERV